MDGSEDELAGRKPPRGIPIDRADQITIVAVGVGILIVTAFLVGLLF